MANAVPAAAAGHATSSAAPDSLDRLGVPRTRPRAARPLVIAFSGGRDSTALLDAACRLRAERASAFRELIAVHVFHGMQPQSESWVEHCRRMCEQLGVPFDLQRVAVNPRARGPEAAAREARYHALAAAASDAGARIVLAAHHLDDRLETFLIQWLRGAGPEGLAAMPAVRVLSEETGDVLIVRPWLDVTRAEIDHYVHLRRLAFVDDPSNSDTRLLRNAIRHHVAPALEAVRPGFRKTAARSIELVAEAADALRELSESDLADCTRDAPAGMLRLDRLRALSAARRAQTVRRWLAACGLSTPPRARLNELIAQALGARADARLLLRLGVHEVRRHRGLLLVRQATRSTETGAVLRWNGETQIPVPAWRGALHFVPTDNEGFDVEWLRAEALELRAREGGERFKPHATRPSRTLKRLFQDAGIAEFERASLPLVWRDGRLIYVAGLGADARLIERGGERVSLQWQPDALLLS